MSTPDEFDPARGWAYVEDLLAQEEAERIEKLTDEEVRAELLAKGVDPSRLPSLEKLIARGLELAAAREREEAKRRS